ncbi:hypothetical protein [Rheinheimera baltica]|uniref:Secreted protein n=1 Tax=Rheinheimera baltica TaxID=67576 RepID=A0ABT9I493_9GAMM|nr:hypothetical protein [Rheinheimera baltica]MDP5138202.1 hypothetical protein [Rheinheimera baltica]MDP5141144.1 hypothetical protein [Rheinheimera baltica]MDP5148373.1 hypothetical protein [Rheinheimera baltica]MDP5189139.1 hypothetical protein [Rheinheimera baltica]
MKKLTILTAVSVLFVVNVLQAKPQEGHEGGKPPKEAIAACEGKAAQDTVTFTGRRGDAVEAVCQQMGDVLAAVPAKGKGKHKDE